jgi:WD40 repeat protein
MKLKQPLSWHQWARRFVAAICCILAGYLSASAQEYVELKGGYYAYENILPDGLDPGMVHQGQFIGGVRWKDEAGENSVILCYDTKPSENRQDIYVYQYCKVGGKVRLVWDIQDFGSPQCRMVFGYGSLQIIDLDQDGTMEVCFLYQNECEGAEVYATKLMLLKDGQKLAFRGKFARVENKEIELQIDPVVANYAPIFKHFMLLQWHEFGAYDISFAKSILYKTHGYLVLEKEYLDASGGTTYQVLDLNGLSLPYPEGMQPTIENANSLALMPDRKTLLYASESGGIGTYDPISKVEHSFMTFFEDNEAISALSWSPDGTKIAFAALNQTQYADATQIFVLHLAGNTMVKKEKFEAKLMYMAAADWVVEAPRFKDNRTLEYRERIIDDEGPREGSLKRIVLK